MSTEQKIMCTVVQMDMFLVDCWKWLLVILLVMGIATLVFFNKKWK